MPDACFADPRLAAIYDALDPDRADLALYQSLAVELGARSVLDIGCGTGVLACRLAERGIATVGLDPAAASLDVAGRRPHGHRVRWIEGDVAQLDGVSVDLVTMTGNVAQVFLRDDDWAAVLRASRDALDHRGHLTFETRVPAARSWEAWTPERSRTTVETTAGPVEAFVQLTHVELPFVSFRWTYRFADRDSELTSESTLRFRDHDELAQSLDAAGFDIRHVRDAPDRPGIEWVFVASPRQRARRE